MLNLINLFLDFAGTINNTIRKTADFVSNDTEGFSRFTGSRGFKLGVEGDNLCLVCYVVNEGYDIPDAFYLFTEDFDSVNCLLVCIKDFVELGNVLFNLGNTFCYIS